MQGNAYHMVIFAVFRGQDAWSACIRRGYVKLWSSGEHISETINILVVIMINGRTEIRNVLKLRKSTNKHYTSHRKNLVPGLSTKTKLYWENNRLNSNKDHACPQPIIK